MEPAGELLLLALRRCLLDAHYNTGHPLWAVWTLDRGVLGVGAMGLPSIPPKGDTLVWCVCAATTGKPASLSTLQIYSQRLVSQYMCGAQLKRHLHTLKDLFSVLASQEGMTRVSCLRLDGVCDDPWLLTRLWKVMGWPFQDIVVDYVRINKSYAEIQYE